MYLKVGLVIVFCKISVVVVGMDWFIAASTPLYHSFSAVSISSVDIFSVVIIFAMFSSTICLNVFQSALFELGLGNIGVVMALDDKVIMIGRWSDSVSGPGSSVML